MEVINERCCGLDVHKKTVVACVITPQGQETRTFRTLTRGLLELAAWLGECQVTHVAMESSGVFWKPVYNLLEGLDLTLLVVKARQIKAVPGRKTDVIKLSSVASNVVGVSGRAMLEALVAGEADPQALAKGRLQQKGSALAEALQGLLGSHQRLMLQSQLRHLDFLEGEMGRLDQEVATRLRPFEEPLQRLDAVPGIGRRSAEGVVAEIGPDLRPFPTAGPLVSWARVCPGNKESGGKRRRGATAIPGCPLPWWR
jgi:transposase